MRKKATSTADLPSRNPRLPFKPIAIFKAIEKAPRKMAAKGDRVAFTVVAIPVEDGMAVGVDVNGINGDVLVTCTVDVVAVGTGSAADNIVAGVCTVGVTIIVVDGRTADIIVGGACSVDVVGVVVRGSSVDVIIIGSCTVDVVVAVVKGSAADVIVVSACPVNVVVDVVRGCSANVIIVSTGSGIRDVTTVQIVVDATIVDAVVDAVVDVVDDTVGDSGKVTNLAACERLITSTPHARASAWS
ncbi:hypothetical protein CBR_g17595 [Chara braunii]|uniref:Uncharacterized protein n=1 Tax=Chara braunii TaxID=69332 RepID=A0A388KVB4_CHABU|nr:hypothetical protein CBR_g17595 [Chara braunii]|eukprot:GBG73883.1 hypothetical protein CBR_g17595 [Chara braunii]